jgi:exodeoxyribonuclease-3
MSAGWGYRRFEDGPGHCWWTSVSRTRKNVGWRIDYVLASPAAMEFVRGAFIRPEVTGSDHCPVGVEVDSAILG